MADFTNEKFMEDLEKDYPNFDWDNFDIETYPDVWKINATMTTRRVFLKTGSVLQSVAGYGIDTEFPSQEAAELFIEQLKSEWTEEKLQVEKLNRPMPYKEYWTMNLESIKAYCTKPADALHLSFCKRCREEILKGEKVFPMYLP